MDQFFYGRKVCIMWAVVVCKEVQIVMKTRSQAREVAKELGGVVRKVDIHAA